MARKDFQAASASLLLPACSNASAFCLRVAGAAVGWPIQTAETNRDAPNMCRRVAAFNFFSIGAQLESAFRAIEQLIQIIKPTKRKAREYASRMPAPFSLACNCGRMGRPILVSQLPMIVL